MLVVHLSTLWFGTCTSFVSLICLCTSYPKKCLASAGLATDVSQQTSRKDRRLATDVSQGQAYLLSSVIMLVHLPSLWFGTCTSFISLTCLCTSYLKKCLASTGLATDVSQGQTHVSQGQTSRNRRLARTGVPSFFCSYACSSS